MSDSECFTTAMSLARWGVYELDGYIKYNETAYPTGLLEPVIAAAVERARVPNPDGLHRVGILRPVGGACCGKAWPSGRFVIHLPLWGVDMALDKRAAYPDPYRLMAEALYVVAVHEAKHIADFQQYPRHCHNAYGYVNVEWMEARAQSAERQARKELGTMPGLKVHEHLRRLVQWLQGNPLLNLAPLVFGGTSTARSDYADQAGEPETTLDSGTSVCVSRTLDSESSGNHQL